MLSISLSTFSQNEFLPDVSAKWTGDHQTWTGQGSGSGGWLQVAHENNNADSIVGPHSYKSLNLTWSDNSTYHYALYRVDTANQQIWWIPEDSTSELMFFDFDETYVVGDTVILSHYYYNGMAAVAEYELTDLDSVEIDGDYFNSYDFYATGPHPIQGNGRAGHITICERMISESSFPFLSTVTDGTTYTRKCYQESGIGLLGDCPWNVWTAGLLDEYDENSFSFFPNPTSGPLNISFDNEVDRKIQIFNSQGSLMISTVTSKSQIEIKTDLSPGIYFLKVCSDGFNQTQKFIKK